MPTGGELVVEGLVRWGVEVVFGLPGVQMDWLYDALAREGSIRVIHTRHEQATSYMADGYARATGRVGTCAVVPGPGVLNAGAGLATAFACNSPVLCVAGQVFARDLGRGRGALHEIPDQLAVLRGVVGWAERATRPEEIPGVVDAAFARLTGPGRLRPAAIEIGWDALMAEAAPQRTSSGPASPTPATVDAAAVEAAAALLADADRPLIWAGGGAMDAGDELLALARTLGAPIVVTAQGKGAVSDREPFVLPTTAGYSLLDRTDVLVIVGSRFVGATGRPRLGEGGRVVRVDVDPAEIARDLVPDAALVTDAAAGCRALADALATASGGPGGSDSGKGPDRLAAAAELKAATSAGLAERFEELAGYCGALRSAVPDDGILVDEMTQVGYFARNGYPVYQPRTYLGSGYQGTLGFGYPTALGAKVGSPGRVVVSIAGDGGFLYSPGELATAVHHDIGVVVVVFNDNAFGNVKRIQSQTFGREIASTLHNPDFVALARSFGMAAERAHGPEELHEVLAGAVAQGGPALIEVPIGPQPDIWPILTGRETVA